MNNTSDALLGRFDNRRKNLQLITHSLNASKSRLTANIPENCVYIPVVDGAELIKRKPINSVLLRIYNFLLDKSRYDYERYHMDDIKTKEDVQILRDFCKEATLPEGSEAIPIGTDETVTELLVIALFFLGGKQILKVFESLIEQNQLSE